MLSRLFLIGLTLLSVLAGVVGNDRERGNTSSHPLCVTVSNELDTTNLHIPELSDIHDCQPLDCNGCGGRQAWLEFCRLISKPVTFWYCDLGRQITSSVVWSLFSEADASSSSLCETAQLKRTGVLLS